MDPALTRRVVMPAIGASDCAMLKNLLKLLFFNIFDFAGRRES